MAFLRETMRGRAMRDSTSKSSRIAPPGWNRWNRFTRVDYWRTVKMASTLAGSTPASPEARQPYQGIRLTPLGVIGLESWQPLHISRVSMTAGLEPCFVRLCLDDLSAGFMDTPALSKGPKLCTNTDSATQHIPRCLGDSCSSRAATHPLVLR